MVFGYDTIGGSTSDYSSFALGSKFTSDQTGNVTALRVYGNCSTVNIKVAIWLDSDKSLLGQGTAAIDGLGWHEVTLSAPVAVTNGVDYWFGARTDDSCTAYYLNGSGTSFYDSGQTYALFPEDPLAASNNSRTYSMYAVFGGAGGLSIPVAIHHYNTINKVIRG